MVSRVSEKRSLLASPQACLDDRLETGARPSTLWVVAAAIARNHMDTGLDVTVHHGGARLEMDELTQDDSPAPSGALPLDLDCFLAIRMTAHRAASGEDLRTKRGNPATILGRKLVQRTNTGHWPALGVDLPPSRHNTCEAV